jgi:Protein of unknown function (DUF3800)
VTPAFGGGPLRGDKIVRLVYLDEAGTSNPKEEPFLVVAGLAVNADRQFKEVEACLDSLLRKHVSEPDGIVFHTMELWHGTKQFDRDHFPLEKRLEILGDVAQIPRKFGLPIFYDSTNRLEIRSALPTLVGVPIKQDLLERVIHAHSFLHFIAQLETFMRENAPDEVAMLIAEDRPEVRSIVKFTHGIFRGRGPKQLQASFEQIKNRLLGRLMPLEKIIETVHFVQKRESSLLQIADLCAFAIKRNMMKAKHWERLYTPLHDQVIHQFDVAQGVAERRQSS